MSTSTISTPEFVPRMRDRTERKPMTIKFSENEYQGKRQFFKPKAGGTSESKV